MTKRRYHLVTPARRGRTGFRSRTHLALHPDRRYKLPRSLCQAENNTPEMKEPLARKRGSREWAEPPFTVEEVKELDLGTKGLCRNCLKLAGCEEARP